MRLAVVNLTGGGLSGGYGKYLKEIVPRLALDARVTRLDVFLPKAVAIDAHEKIVLHHLMSTRRIRAQLQRSGVEVIFVPTARRFAFGNIPSVIMVRNMEALVQPWGENSLGVGVKNLARRTVAWNACRQADGIVAVSEFVRDFLVSRWRQSEAKIAVVPHGVDVLPTPDALTLPGGSVVPGNRPPSLLAVGSLRPFRGLEDILRAMVTLSREQAGARLFVAGQADPDTLMYEKYLRGLCNELEIGDAVVWLGQLSQAELAAQYRSCDCFVMSSRVEACPNVALEALAYGCQVVSTNSRPMPEFFGDVACYYPAGDSQALALAVSRVLDSAPDEQRDRRQQALARATRFDWDDTATKTMDLLAAAARREVCAR